MEYKIVTLGNDPWSEDLKRQIADFPHYKTAKEWIENINIPMEETTYYKWLQHQLDTSGSVWNGILSSKEDITRQYNNFKRLFEIAPNFKIVLPISRIINGVTHYFGPICTKIADNGDINIWDGMHRISILHALNQPIQFTICERQEKWQSLVDDIKALYPSLLYQAIPHPDFADCEHCFNDAKEAHIADIVKAHNIKSVLDLGSCHGHTLYSIRNLLESATGVEYNAIRYRVLRLLFNKIGFESYHTNIFDVVSQNSKHFDCVFALAVFHHFARENPIEKFEELLGRIRSISNMLLYELPEPSEEQYDWMYPSTDMHELIQLRYSSKTVIPMQKRKLMLLQG